VPAPDSGQDYVQILNLTPRIRRFCDFRVRTKLVEFYGATAFTYAVAPKAILRTKLHPYTTGFRMSVPDSA
jgi:hypothetical protein